jgi:hypothetical protein
MKNSLSVLLFSLALLQYVGADELFVRNRAFRGSVSQQGLSRYVSATSFAKALRAAVNYADGTLYLGPSEQKGEFEGQTVRFVNVNGLDIPFLLENGEVMVPLKDTVEALKARMTVSKELGTTDIYPPEEEPPRSSQSNDSNASAAPATVAKPGYAADPGYRPTKDESGRYGYVNRSGGFVIEPRFFQAREFKHGLAAACKCRGSKVVKKNKYVITRGSYEGLSPEQKKVYDRGVSRKKILLRGNWGFIDSTGEWVIRPSYTHASDFVEKEIKGEKMIVSLVTKGNKRWYINLQGKKVAKAPDR